MHRVLTRKLKRRILRNKFGRGARSEWLEYQNKQSMISKIPNSNERIRQLAKLDAKYFG